MRNYKTALFKSNLSLYFLICCLVWGNEGPYSNKNSVSRGPGKNEKIGVPTNVKDRPNLSVSQTSRGSQIQELPAKSTDNPARTSRSSPSPSSVGPSSKPIISYNDTKSKEKIGDKCNLLSVWNFDEGILTDQKGFYNQLSAGESEVKLNFSNQPRRGDGGRSLKITYNKKEKGFCVLWAHLFDEEEPSIENRFVDVSGYNFISFWVKGAEGGEDFTVQMADLNWLKKDDSKPAGLVSKFLGGPITTEWQEVTVPLQSFGLHTSNLSTFVLNFTEKGSGKVYIDDINFKSEIECEIPLSEPELVPLKNHREFRHAMWVWEVKPLLFDEGKRKEFFNFCRSQKIDEIFLQIPYNFVNDLTPDVECVINYPEELRTFIRLSRNEGILMHALDGYPEFVLTEHHPRVLAQVKAIHSFNQDSALEERFYGIHLDNEPYQLLGFEGDLSQSILLQYLDLNQKIMALLREEQSEMVYGVDIPFWFDESKNEDGSLTYSLTYNGKTKDAAQHVIDIVDNVGIMNYRNFAGGADGMIRHGQGEIDYANKVGKKIYLGVETFKYEPSKVSFIYSNLEQSMSPAAQNEDRERQPLVASKFDNFPIRTIKTNSNDLLGLVQPQELDDRLNFNAAISKLFKIYGPTTFAKSINRDDLEFAARISIGNNPKYEGFDPFLFEDEQNKAEVFGFDTTENMLEKITFAGKTRSEMKEVLAEVEHAFSKKEAFIGFAIHYYKTYKSMPE